MTGGEGIPGALDRAGRAGLAILRPTVAPERRGIADRARLERGTVVDARSAGAIGIHEAGASDVEGIRGPRAALGQNIAEQEDRRGELEVDVAGPRIASGR